MEVELAVGRRGMLARAAALAALAIVRPTRAANYPTRPIHLIVPFAPGGTADALARPLAIKLGEALGQSVVVENRPGGLTVIGADLVAKASADGHTLYFMPGTHVLIPYMVKSVPFRPLQDFTPIITIGYLPYIIVANAEQSYRTLPQLVDFARMHPEVVTIGVSDAVTQVAAKAFELASKAKFTTVAYKGGGPLGTDLVGGQIATAVGAANLMPFVKEGRLRSLAVTATRRVHFLPDVPTVAEAIPGSNFDVQTWYAIAGPANMPSTVVQRLYSALQKILGRSDMEGRLSDFGMVGPDDASPAATGRLMQQYQARMSKLVKAAGIVPQ